MFGRRPRYDDTFGVRMDLGADRMDPISMRPAAKLKMKETVLVERPGSIFGGSGRRESDPFAALRAKPEPRPLAQQREPRRAPAPRSEGPRTLEDGVRKVLRGLSVTQRIGLSFIAGWFLLASGLWVVAAVIAVVWFTRRKRTG